MRSSAAACELGADGCAGDEDWWGLVISIVYLVIACGDSSQIRSHHTFATEQEWGSPWSASALLACNSCYTLKT
jgi:hypothetical protein